MKEIKPRKKPRKYTGPLQHFHNFEHDPKGRTHCESNGNHPYTIEHANGKHVISRSVAIGHGRGGKPQMFRFPVHLHRGYDLSKGVKIAPSRSVRITPRRPRIGR